MAVKEARSFAQVSARPHIERDVFSDDSVRRTNALFTFALWFAAGGYITSTILPYLPALEGTLPTVVGGLCVSGIAAALKTT